MGIKRNNVENQAMEYLKQRKFREAIEMVAAYQSDQDFHQETGIYLDHNPARDIAILTTIFDSKPKILAGLKEDQVEPLRLAAGMATIFGKADGTKWLPDDFEIGLSMYNDAAVNMLIFHATNKYEISDWTQSEVVVQVEILAAPNSCDNCKEISGKRFNLHDVIELPYEHCTYVMGCRCTLLPMVE